MIKGVDVSHWNKNIGIQSLLMSGADISFIIAKHSQGANMFDSEYEKYKSIANDYKIPFGGYYYVDDTTTYQYALDRLIEIKKSGVNIPPIIDYESKQNKRFGTDEGDRLIISLINTYTELYGKPPMLYAQFSYFKYGELYKCLVNYNVPIWVARYKYTKYVPSLSKEYGVKTNALQPLIIDTWAAFQQVQDKCCFNGVNYSLDFDVCFRPKLLMEYTTE